MFPIFVQIALDFFFLFWAEVFFCIKIPFFVAFCSALYRINVSACVFMHYKKQRQFVWNDLEKKLRNKNCNTQFVDSSFEFKHLALTKFEKKSFFNAKENENNRITDINQSDVIILL